MGAASGLRKIREVFDDVLTRLVGGGGGIGVEDMIDQGAHVHHPMHLSGDRQYLPLLRLPNRA